MLRRVELSRRRKRSGPSSPATLTIALPPAPGSARTQTTLVGTISSDGRIRVFDLGAVPAAPDGGAPAESGPLAEYDSKGSRLTCMTMADGDDLAAAASALSKAGEKRKREEEEDEMLEEDLDIEDVGDGGKWHDRCIC